MSRSASFRRRSPTLKSSTVLALFVVPFLVYAQSSASMSKADLRESIDKLWDDHVTWTRLYIVSAAADLPDKDLTAQRLLQNQSDIGNAIKPVYGEAAGEKLTGLLKEHIMISTEIIAAAKTSDTAKQEEASNRWNTNADEIATFLSSANPKNWPAPEMKTMMREHLKLTTDEAVARLHGDWGGRHCGLRQSA
jgi:hypothetical protein